VPVLLTRIPTRKTDVWGTLVSVRCGVLQQWYPHRDERGQQERANGRPGRPQGSALILTMRIKIASWPVVIAGAVALVSAVCFAIYGIHAKLPTMLIWEVVAAIFDPIPLVASFAEPIRSSYPNLRRALRSTFLSASLFTAAGLADEFGRTKLAGLATAAGLATFYLLTRRFTRRLRPDGPGVK
jgi:hypothetical protein